MKPNVKKITTEKCRTSASAQKAVSKSEPAPGSVSLRIQKVKNRKKILSAKTYSKNIEIIYQIDILETSGITPVKKINNSILQERYSKFIKK
ncbi:hypothetical protein [Chromobacterium violaceum]